jgi:hypothetical protein
MPDTQQIAATADGRNELRAVPPVPTWRRVGAVAESAGLPAGCCSGCGVVGIAEFKVRETCQKKLHCAPRSG